MTYFTSTIGAPRVGTDDAVCRDLPVPTFPSEMARARSVPGALETGLLPSQSPPAATMIEPAGTSAGTLNVEGQADLAPDDGDPQAVVEAADPSFALARGGLKLSGGYSTLERFRLRAEISRTFASGQQVAAVASWSSLRTQLLGELTGALSGKRAVTYSLGAFAERQRALGFFGSGPSSFGQRGAGIYVSLREAVTDKLAVGLTLRLAREEFALAGSRGSCDPAQLSGIVCAEVGQHLRASAAVTLDYDRRDSAAVPGWGFRIRFVQSVTSSRTQIRYLKSEASFERYLPYGDEWTIATTIDAGLIHNVAARGASLFDRFFVGGTTLHGFDLRGVSPRIRPSSPSAKSVTAAGGRYFYAARIELAGRDGSGPTLGGIHPSLFVEAASAFGLERRRLLPGETAFGDSPFPRVSVGLGVRWRTPVGSARFDVALPVIKRTGDRTRIFSFSLGL